MPKRKSKPKRADESKRQLISWNLNDLGREGVQVVVDHDPSLAAEMTAATANSSRQLPMPSGTSEIEDLLARCNFYLSIRHSLDDSEWHCFIASFNIRISHEDLSQVSDAMTQVDSLWLYANSFEPSYYLYHERDAKDPENPSGSSSSQKATFCFKVESEAPFSCLEALNMKCFELKFMELNSHTRSLELGIYGKEGILTKLKFPSEGWRPTKKNSSVQTLMSHFYSLRSPDYSGCVMVKKHDIQVLYELIKRHHTQNPKVVKVQAQHLSLRPILRDYQKNAVLWMLSRERIGQQNHEKFESRHPLYTKVTVKDGKELYYSKDGGYLVCDEPLLPTAPPGGILADEMGLGKTVEVLSCILCHPRTGLPQTTGWEANLSNGSSESEKEAVMTDGSESKDVVCDSPDIRTLAPKEDDSNDLRTAPLLESLIDKCMEENAESEKRQSEMAENLPVLKAEHNYSHKKVEIIDAYTHYDDVINAVAKADGGEVKEGQTELKENGESLQKHHIECVCGNKRNQQDSLIECTKCQSHQHPKCMNYDTESKHRDPYLCPHCIAASPPIPSGATLIVSPKTISHQWVEEIEKHVRNESLKVLVYSGVNKQGFVQPRTLADQDIVVTTYDTLGREINYVDLPHTASEAGRRFRKPKRFMATPSPITAIEWWRICLDEAQMVECTSTRTAEMALRLNAVNRWCVTGTPIQRSIEGCKLFSGVIKIIKSENICSDLYGLLLFLGVEPFWVKHWWNTLLYQPYCYGNRTPLVENVAQVLWRTCKKDVIEQIGLPLQTEEMHWLTFSPVEEHFYRRQYDKCAGEALSKLGKYDDINLKMSSFDRQTLHQLLYPLLRLRQACCHPQVVKGEFLPIHKSTMSMEELLDQLIKKTRVEGEEAHRQCVAAINGLAALCLIEDDLPGAVDHYRNAMRSIDEHREKLRTDDLQELHTIHNLSEVLAKKPLGVDPTLRDDQLQKQAEDLKAKYLAKAAASVSQSQETWLPLKDSLDDLKAEWSGSETWWAEMLQWVTSEGLDNMLLDKVRDDLINFREIRTLEFVIVRHLDQLDKIHDDLVLHLTSLRRTPTRNLINETVECCLRPVNVERMDQQCPFCKADEMFQSYECKLYSFVEKKGESSNADDMKYLTSNRRQGTWADSQVERALKSMIAFARGFNVLHLGARQWCEPGNQHIKILDALKKEFRALRSLWMSLREQVSAFDEIDMATLRFRLRFPDEPASETPQPHIIERVELGQQKLKLMSDRVIGQNDTQRKLGQLLYLKNLAKWSVLQCGHCYCLECIKVLVSRSNNGGAREQRLRCPVCRQMASFANISYVSTRRQSDEELTRVKGDHSTKVAGVVQCLKEIKHKDPSAKALVFSTWQEVLDVLSQAFTDNDISFKSLLAQNKFQRNLKSFKEEADVSVLLLPVHSGSNGLNLIEATHVLLVEPILNPAQELQAIGRIHRIGQLRPTVIHRFIVRGTIEEPLSSLLKANPQTNLSTEETPFSIGDLRSLFQNDTE
ncbi:hypothetical protein CAPTEDRAFT_220844 [Capitella teleta]|uniref:E3 ubiquitin-protein ligase SHPRH n=1 Tax=Capitella teleta TaxID=283909 RepID=R7U2Z1_CAPTE|nr:hypothetical protein CAPTEDRAFT_220844 [Capitella teleta]|eukprot:ELU00238.1 hypothetical protein CAPTEDRAFT_220844 [Capitella teleta]